MPARLIDGKAIAAKVRAEVAAEVRRIREQTGVTAGLALVRVGEDPASVVYVNGKIKACKEAGLASFEHLLPADTAQEALLSLVRRLNQDPAVHGVLVQLPLPRGLDAAAVMDLLAAEKDADGFGPRSTYLLSAGRPGLRPCTPLGCLRLLDEAGVQLEGKRALVIGRSNIVGKPMAQLFLERNATVTIAHSRTPDLAAEVARADVVVAAVGRPELVKGAWVKPGAAVLDVGMNRLPSGKLLGDVEFAAAAERAGFLTPVPGGVGPMTIAMLLANTVAACKQQLGLE
jgi:methylenetetrahydrofolate dehydrogenase (NADP+) / methenyltetrahydrofolate cyclohydrolase